MKLEMSEREALWVSVAHGWLFDSDRRAFARFVSRFDRTRHKYAPAGERIETSPTPAVTPNPDP